MSSKIVVRIRIGPPGGPARGGGVRGEGVPCGGEAVSRGPGRPPGSGREGDTCTRKGLRRGEAAAWPMMPVMARAPSRVAE